MSEQDWLTLRDWLRQMFGPSEGSELFSKHVHAAREMNQAGPREYGPGF